jgi:hypothetical protein
MILTEAASVGEQEKKFKSNRVPSFRYPFRDVTRVLSFVKPVFHQPLRL